MLGAAPPVRDLVLVGGGHSHVQVLRAFGMRPEPGVRVTIISREVHTPYSGMLPGHVAGFYGWRDIHIDLGPLAAFAGARLIADEVVGLDPEARTLSLSAHPPLSYDLLSVNSGAVPSGTPAAGVPVKPIGRFLPGLEAVRRAAAAGDRVAIIGGGAGGVELALAMRRTLPEAVALTVVTERLLPGHGAGVRRRLEGALARAGVEVVTGFAVRDYDGSAVLAGDGRRVPAEHAFWVTGVRAPAWPAAAGLATDGDGFIEVDRHLRSVSHGDVFAAGDVACLTDQPRPKSGVFAVREGPVLAANLRRALLGRRLKRYRAQRWFLSLIGTGDGRAVASKGVLSASGRWVWRWKDFIDRRFMARFNELPEMPEPAATLPATFAAEAPEAMRCGGCGAKLGAEPLRRVLARLPPQNFAGVEVGIGDDAAIVGASGSVVLTVDGFRSLVSDPYLFGRITAHHAYNDILAMGARGTAALALATVPLAAERLMEEDLFLLLHGAVDVLNAHGVPLVGGHSAEGAELSLALSLTGAVVAPALGKSGLRAGDRLILTKPLGTGVIMAGQMRGRVPSDAVQAALSAMDTSNCAALAVFRRHRVSAATDVSGFGLLGHLGEMLRASGCGVAVDLAAVPLLPGAAEAMAAGIASSLQRNNELALIDYSLHGCGPTEPRVRLAVDPQTSGGLLAAVPADESDACVAELVEAGYPEAAEIGRAAASGWEIRG